MLTRLHVFNLCYFKLKWPNAAWQYATSTFPIMQALFSISHGMAVIPRRNDKQRLCNCFFWGGGGGEGGHALCERGKGGIWFHIWILTNLFHPFPNQFSSSMDWQNSLKTSGLSSKISCTGESNVKWPVSCIGGGVGPLKTSEEPAPVKVWVHSFVRSTVLRKIS